MNKKIKVNTYCRSFAYISFLNNKKKTYRAHFKLFPFLRKKVKGLEHYSYITVNNNQYKKLIKLERGGAAPTDLIENNINQRECNEEHYEQTNEKEYFDDFDDIDEEIINNLEDDFDEIDDWYPFDEPHTIIINSDGLDDILKELFNKLEEGKKDEIDNKEDK